MQARGARDRGVSFEDSYHSNHNNSRPRNDVASGRQIDRSRLSTSGNLLKLDLTEKVKKNFSLQKQYERKGLEDLSLRKNHLTKFGATDDDRGWLMVTLHPADLIELRLGVLSIVNLDLSENRLSEFLPGSLLTRMTKLKKLSMGGNRIANIPLDSLLALEANGCIEELNLNNNTLEQLPSEIGLLKSLRKFNLSHNKLVTLPPEIVNLEGLYDSPEAFNIGDNKTLMEPPHQVAQQGGLEWIRTYFQISSGCDVPTTDQYLFNLRIEQVNHGKKHTKTGGPGRRSLQLKLLVVGRDGAGKTSVIAKLRDAQNHHNHPYGQHGHHGHTRSFGGGGETPGPIRTFSTEDAASTGHLTPVRGCASTSAKESSLGGAVGLTDPAGAAAAAAAVQLPTSSSDATGSPFHLSGSRPVTPNTCQSNAAFTPARSDAQGKLDCMITPWYPKKSVLDKFILPKTVDNKKMDKAAKSLFTVEPDDIKFTIWNFVGSWMFHAVHEMFFSESALHMVVFDLNLTVTENDCDKYVQYWIDLIQARAPGSSFIVVATKADLLSVEEERKRLNMVQARLKNNEKLRVEDLRSDIKHCLDLDKEATYRLLLTKRPVVDEHIIALRAGETSDEEQLNEILCLSVRIVQLATPTKKEHHAFSDLVNAPLEDFYWSVRESIKALRQQGNSFCKLKDLDAHILERSNAGSSKHTKKTLLSGTKLALAHWSSVGEVLWFNSDQRLGGSGEKESALYCNHEPQVYAFRPLTRAMTGNLSLDVSEVVFLDPNWLMSCIKTMLAEDLVRDIELKYLNPLVMDDQARLDELILQKNKDFARRGIIKWEYIRSFLEWRDYDPEIVDVVRRVLEKFSVLIPIRSENPALSDSQDKTSSAGKGGPEQPAPIARHRTEPGISSTAPISPGRSSRAQTSVTKGHAPGGSHFGVLLEAPSAIDQRYYLVPSLLPQYHDDISAASGKITLERTFHFSRFTPPGLVQALFARIYTLQGGTEEKLLAGTKDKNLCWDRAFTLNYANVAMLVLLVPVSDPSVASEGVASPWSSGEGGYQDLHIRGICHTFNRHYALEQLDKYTTVTQQILAEYPGLGHVRLSSTCPDCLLSLREKSQCGVFWHSEVVALQDTLVELTDLLQRSSHGRMSNAVRGELRKWNSRRLTCPKVRVHQIKADTLIHVSRPLNAEIERASHAEKEINFLLDEVVLSSAVQLHKVTGGVVKIVAANCLEGTMEEIKNAIQESEAGHEFGAVIKLSVIQYSSGAIVSLPDGHPLVLQSSPLERTNEVVVVSCEHIITKAERKGGKFVYSRKCAVPDKEAVFLIGDATHWLYLAEMIFQGSQQEGSESSFWDFCALRIIAPIKPIDQIASIKSSDPSAPSKSVDQIQSIEPEKEATELHVHVILRGSQPSFGLEATTSVMSINTAEDTDCVELLHPRRRLSPMHTIPVSTQPVCVDQVVRRLGYPGFPQMMDLSVDSGRVEQNDPAGDILISLLSDDGASGGPVIDREGKLIGLLSRSHTFIKFSCVQPLRNMFEILRQNEL